MTHPCSKLTDAEINAIQSRHFKRSIYIGLALLASFIASVAFAVTCWDSLVHGDAAHVAGTVAFIFFIGLFVYVGDKATNPNELSLLENETEILDQTVALLSRSKAAGQLRDAIKSSGRSLRVFDFFDFLSADEKAMHEQKMQQVNGLNRGSE